MIDIYKVRQDRDNGVNVGRFPLSPRKMRA